MVNPGFIAEVSETKIQKEAGQVIYCPKCKKPLMEANIESLNTRCKHCKKWIYLKKIVDNSI